MSPAHPIVPLARRSLLGAAMARRVAHGFTLRLCATAVDLVLPLGNSLPVTRDGMPQGCAGLVFLKATCHGKTSCGLVEVTLARLPDTRHHVSFGGATC